MAELPAQIVIDILSRLPVKSILHCRCVCKTWLNLLSETYFVNLHLSRSAPGLIIHHNLEDFATQGANPGILKLVEIEDEPNHHNFHHDPVMNLDLRLGVAFQESHILLVASANGLLCLWQNRHDNDNTYICNPITREYMILPKQEYYREGYEMIVYGFGFSLVTGQYKVVRIFQDSTSTSRPSLLEGEIYTLGTGEWRSLGHVPFRLNGFHGPFLNGYVHWIVMDQENPEKICCFDFEKETFQLFPSPPETSIIEGDIQSESLGVLKGCLCQCYSSDSEFVIWVMKEYGIKKSWNKEAVIRPNSPTGLDWLSWVPVYLVEALKDGTILMIYYEEVLLAYCPERKTVEDTKIFKRYFWGMAYVPSFIRLKNFKHENVHVF